MNKKIVWEYFEFQIEPTLYKSVNPRALSPYEDGWTQSFYLENPTYILKSGIGTIDFIGGRVSIPRRFLEKITSLFRINNDQFEEFFKEWVMNSYEKLNVDFFVYET